MTKVLTDPSYYTAIADAIRAKNSATTKYKPSEMAAAIQAITTGGSSSGSSDSGGTKIVTTGARRTAFYVTFTQQTLVGDGVDDSYPREITSDIFKNFSVSVRAEPGYKPGTLIVNGTTQAESEMSYWSVSAEPVNGAITLSTTQAVPYTTADIVGAKSTFATASLSSWGGSTRGTATAYPSYGHIYPGEVSVSTTSDGGGTLTISVFNDSYYDSSSNTTISAISDKIQWPSSATFVFTGLTSGTTISGTASTETTGKHSAHYAVTLSKISDVTSIMTEAGGFTVEITAQTPAAGENVVAEDLTDEVKSGETASSTQTAKDLTDTKLSFPAYSSSAAPGSVVTSTYVRSSGPGGTTIVTSAYKLTLSGAYTIGSSGPTPDITGAEWPKQIAATATNGSTTLNFTATRTEVSTGSMATSATYLLDNGREALIALMTAAASTITITAQRPFAGSPGINV